LSTQYKGKLGYPKPKSKKKGLGSFRLTDSIVIFPDAIRLPRLERKPRVKLAPVKQEPNALDASA